MNNLLLIPAQKIPPRNDVIEFDRIGFRHMEINFPIKIPQLHMSWNVKSLATAKDPQDAYTLTII